MALYFDPGNTSRPWTGELISGVQYPLLIEQNWTAADLAAIGLYRHDPIPTSVTRRQILTGLAVVGWITEAEALAALTVGATPAAVDAVINGLPAEQQFAARMKWAGFRDALRDDEMVAALAVVEGKTGPEIDEFFRLCAGIA